MNFYLFLGGSIIYMLVYTARLLYCLECALRVVRLCVALVWSE